MDAQVRPEVLLARLRRYRLVGDFQVWLETAEQGLGLQVRPSIVTGPSGPRCPFHTVKESLNQMRSPTHQAEWKQNRTGHRLSADLVPGSPGLPAMPPGPAGPQ